VASSVGGVGGDVQFKMFLFLGHQHTLFGRVRRNTNVGVYVGSRSTVHAYIRAYLIYTTY
jgi:hypothetical protein